jgi:2-isopropylmalate synthase
MSRAIQIYDTTLRDGTQAEGVSFSLDDKIDIARRLDELGVACVEAGWPSNTKDVEFFQRARFLTLKTAKIAAFGSTRHAKNAAHDDPGLKALAESGAAVITLFGKAWDFHVDEALRVPRETNLAMIRESVAFVKKHAEEVIFDAEHFFDGYRANRDYALAALEAAVAGGADRLVLCDTNGGCLPNAAAQATEEVAKRFGKPVGIHTHNDSGLALANALAAIDAGADQVHGTINGFGERSGNLDLCIAIPTIELKLGRPCLPPGRLEKLTSLSLYIYDMLGLAPQDRQPYVGRSAFAHKGGVHVSGVNRNPKTYEHVTPESVGNVRRILISELSGRSNILAQAKIDLSKNEELAAKIRERVQEMEAYGYLYEAAEASFELLALQTSGKHQPAFDLHGFRVISEKRADGQEITEATINIKIGDKAEHMAAFGDGPVDALFNALLKALRPSFPSVDEIRLVNYVVRIINPKAATAARVRVIIEFRGPKGRWRTVGVDENIIEASWKALVDGLEYKLLQDKGEV